MEVEERYIVVKRKHLNETELSVLEAVVKVIGGEVMDCLVVENDWPEYAPTLKLLSDRVDGKTWQPAATPLVDTSKWQACNPACDPEFGGYKSLSCTCDPAKAAMQSADEISKRVGSGESNLESGESKSGS